MLRHEASATDERDSSFLGMTEVKKDWNDSGAEPKPKTTAIAFQINLSIKIFGKNLFNVTIALR
ncbi:hypothetical protein [Pedobacter sp. Leaf170]|uniref:hypothetical protein n=1 Tax=Pedobacter sp. Leaf170 TaxID=2876558 RepID=UPI001E3D58E7|nr:hypothetical protein [Pedobacter sp. Leaf170]